MTLQARNAVVEAMVGMNQLMMQNMQRLYSRDARSRQDFGQAAGVHYAEEAVSSLLAWERFVAREGCFVSDMQARCEN